MSKRRKPKIKETEEGVKVTYEGRILPPFVPPVKKPRCCPACGEGPVASSQRYGSTKFHYLYKCPRCVDRETCQATRWKEPRPYEE